MSKCRAVAFYNEDLDVIDPVFTVFGVDRAFFDEGPAVTIMIGDKVAGSLGISEMFKGVGVAWCLMDKHIPSKYKRRVALICKEEMHKKMERFEFHRMQADVAMGCDVAHRFVKFLGLKSEGIMKAFGPDKEDYERYALVRC
jgi:hypothetical protein